MTTMSDQYSLPISINSASTSDRMSANINLGEDEPQTMVPCRVCDTMIEIGPTKKDQHVVKCEYCNEATPIRDPPQGQKYIRCQCNCLLICKSTAQRISCPRPKCHRIIVLCRPSAKDTPKPSDISPVPGMCRVSCGHCKEIFLFNSLVNQLARCPHCEKKSSVGRDFARARGHIFLFLSALALLIGVYLTVITHTSTSRGTGWIASYVLLYISALYFLYRSIYFLTMKKSIIVQDQP